MDVDTFYEYIANFTNKKFIDVSGKYYPNTENKNNPLLDTIEQTSKDELIKLCKQSCLKFKWEIKDMPLGGRCAFCYFTNIQDYLKNGRTVFDLSCKGCLVDRNICGGRDTVIDKIYENCGIVDNIDMEIAQSLSAKEYNEVIAYLKS